MDYRCGLRKGDYKLTLKTFSERITLSLSGSTLGSEIPVNFDKFFFSMESQLILTNCSYSSTGLSVGLKEFIITERNQG